MPSLSVQELSELYSTDNLNVRVYVPIDEPDLHAVVYVKNHVTRNDILRHLRKVAEDNNLSKSSYLAVVDVIYT